jgi:hypothetical protein
MTAFNSRAVRKSNWTARSSHSPSPSNPDLSGALQSGSTPVGIEGRARTALVALQVALSVLLLIGATLLMQSMYRLYFRSPKPYRPVAK